jgi:hypothetical protein
LQSASANLKLAYHIILPTGQLFQFTSISLYLDTAGGHLVYSVVNLLNVVSRRMVKKQQMRWSQRGAHFLLQVRTRDLNDELKEISLQIDAFRPG